jgi:hypothetical protein
MDSLVQESSFLEGVYAFLELVKYRAAVSDAEKERVYRMRYDAYLKEGALLPGAPVIFKDRFDDLANGLTICVYVEGALVSSMRIHVLSKANPDTPAMQVFADKLQPLIDNGMVIIDPTRFVNDVVRMRLYPKIPYATVRIAAMACEHYHADLALATVRAEHQPFYKRVFGPPDVIPARPYPTLAKPISLMAFDAYKLRQRILDRYPFMASTPQERAKLFDV